MKRWGRDGKDNFILYALIVTVGLFFIAALLVFGSSARPGEEHANQEIPGSVGDEY